MTRILATLSAALIISGCAHDAPAGHAQLHVPPRMALPAVQKSELQCLTDDVAKRLKLRQTILIGRVKTLEGIIRSTQEQD